MHKVVFPPCCLTWGQTMVQLMKIMVTSLKISHACTVALSAPKPTASHRWPSLCWRLLDTHGQVWVTLFWRSLFLSLWSQCTQGFVCALQESVSPVLCWWLHGEVNGDLLQQSLCHTQVYWIQSPWPGSSPLLTHTYTGDTQTQFLLSLCGVFGSWYTQGLFEHSKHLWNVWGLILNAIPPLLPSCWGLSFAFGHEVSFLLVRSNILLSTVAQQWFVILEFFLSGIPSLCGLSVAHQALLSMDFFRQEYWNELLFPPPGDLPDLGIELTFLWIFTAFRFFSTEPPSFPGGSVMKNLPAQKLTTWCRIFLPMQET